MYHFTIGMILLIMNKLRKSSLINRIFSSKESDILVVIPARSGSKRLKDKNIYPVNGTPMMINSANQAKNMKAKPRVIISIDSPRYSKICKENNIDYSFRINFLGSDSAPKQDVIRETCISLYEKEKYLPSYVISLQANSPDITTDHLDRIYEHHLKQIDFVYRETISVDTNGDQNGAIRIMNIASVFQNSLSTYLTTYPINLRDIHTIEDL